MKPGAAMLKSCLFCTLVVPIRKQGTGTRTVESYGAVCLLLNNKQVGT